jgi:hypothetical protein
MLYDVLFDKRRSKPFEPTLEVFTPTLYAVMALEAKW